MFNGDETITKIKNFITYEIVKRWQLYRKEFGVLPWWRRLFLMIGLVGTGSMSISAWYAKSAQKADKKPFYKVYLNYDHPITLENIESSIFQPHGENFEIKRPVRRKSDS